MKWYEERYVNHRDWILEHLEYLNLSEKELVVVFVIDYLNQHHENITLDLLCKKTGYKKKDLDDIISTLCARQYLDILASSKDVRFSLNGLFETEVAKDVRVLDAPLFETFETEFKRPLSQKEMQKISDWNRNFDRKMIIYALREASAYQKLNLAYMESILNTWRQKGYRIEDIEKGKSHENN